MAMIPGDEWGLNFLVFVLQLRENPGKTSTRKLTQPGIEPGPAACEVTMLYLDHSAGPQESRGRNYYSTIYSKNKILLLIGMQNMHDQ